MRIEQSIVRFSTICFCAGALSLIFGGCLSVRTAPHALTGLSPAHAAVVVNPGESVSVRKALPRTAVLQRVQRVNAERSRNAETGVRFRFARGLVPGYRVRVSSPAGKNREVEVKFSLVESPRGFNAARRIHLKKSHRTGVIERSATFTSEENAVWIFEFPGNGPVRVEERGETGELVLVAQ